jgi:hypothetical protein
MNQLILPAFLGVIFCLGFDDVLYASFANNPIPLTVCCFELYAIMVICDMIFRKLPGIIYSPSDFISTVGGEIHGCELGWWCPFVGITTALCCVGYCLQFPVVFCKVSYNLTVHCAESGVDRLKRVVEGMKSNKKN